jgi:hypothetical protein
VAWSVRFELSTAGASRNSPDTRTTSRLVHILQALGYLYNTATLHTSEVLDTCSEDFEDTFDCLEGQLSHTRPLPVAFFDTYVAI